MPLKPAFPANVVYPHTWTKEKKSRFTKMAKRNMSESSNIQSNTLGIIIGKLAVKILDITHYVIAMIPPSVTNK